MKKLLKRVGIALVVLIVIVVVARGKSSTNTSKFEVQETLQDGEDRVDTMSALEQAEIAFIGNPPKAEIKEKLDLALQLYSTDITEENYSRAGSTLVTLRKESKAGVTEMEILDYMIKSYVENVSMTFPEMAALSFSALEVGLN